jgi:hypothetical protein
MILKWSALAGLQSGVTAHFGSTKYYSDASVVAAMAVLETTKSWTITDGGVDDACHTNIVSDIKLLNDCILSYGAFETQYDQRGDYDNAHSDITFYYAGSDNTASNIPIGGITLAKGGSGGTFYASGGLGSNADYFDTEGTAYLSGTVTSEDIIDLNKGALLIWFTIETVSAGDAIFGFGDADDYFQAVMDGDGNIDVTYRSQNTSEPIVGAIALGEGEYHCLKIQWDDTDKVSCFIDGVENGDSPEDIANVWDGLTSGTLYIGADYAGSNIADITIHEMYITDDPNTPEIWTAFGKPLWTPLVTEG